MIGSSPARGRMKYRVTFERLHGTAQDKDSFGQPGGNWDELPTVSCHCWAARSGGNATRAGDARTITTNLPGMIVPRGTDVTPADRVQQVVDRAGMQLFGVMKIVDVNTRPTHVELTLLEIV
jgi:hypothetical protein